MITLSNSTEYVTRSHEMSRNLKLGNLRYLHVSNLQVLLVILILESRFYSKKKNVDAGVAEAILRKSALKFSEHISANTPKLNAYRLILQKPDNTQTDPH